MLNWNAIDETKQTNSKFPEFTEGDHTVQVADWALKDNKSGTGKHICVTLEAADGSRKKLWTNFNFEHTNPQVVSISMRQLKSLVEACGLTTNDVKDITDIGLLQGRKLNVTLAKKDDFLNVTRYEAANAESNLPF